MFKLLEVCELYIEYYRFISSLLLGEDVKVLY